MDDDNSSHQRSLYVNEDDYNEYHAKTLLLKSEPAGDENNNNIDLPRRRKTKSVKKSHSQQLNKSLHLDESKKQQQQQLSSSSSSSLIGGNNGEKTYRLPNNGLLPLCNPWRRSLGPRKHLRCHRESCIVAKGPRRPQRPPRSWNACFSFFSSCLFRCCSSCWSTSSLSSSWTRRVVTLSGIIFLLMLVEEHDQRSII